VTTKLLDREKREHYNLTVMATDGIHQTAVKVTTVYNSHSSSLLQKRIQIKEEKT
jgi:hypothetical protein